MIGPVGIHGRGVFAVKTQHDRLRRTLPVTGRAQPIRRARRTRCTRSRRPSAASRSANILATRSGPPCARRTDRSRSRADRSTQRHINLHPSASECLRPRNRDKSPALKGDALRGPLVGPASRPRGTCPATSPPAPAPRPRVRPDRTFGVPAPEPTASRTGRVSRRRDRSPVNIAPRNFDDCATSWCSPESPHQPGRAAPRHRPAGIESADQSLGAGDRRALGHPAVARLHPDGAWISRLR
jgi:hypothetical protein